MRWLASYVDQVVTRDARQLDNRDPERLRRYLRANAAVTGTITEHKTLYDAAGIDRRTAAAYDDLLVALGVTAPVPAWASNELKRLTRAPKRHLADPALAVPLLGIDEAAVLRDGDRLGRLFESFVALHLRALIATARTAMTLHHVRTDGREVDFLIERADRRVIAVEVKAKAAVTARDAATLRWLRGELGERVARGTPRPHRSSSVPARQRRRRGPAGRPRLTSPRSAGKAVAERPTPHRSIPDATRGWSVRSVLWQPDDAGEAVVVAIERQDVADAVAAHHRHVEGIPSRVPLIRQEEIPRQLERSQVHWMDLIDDAQKDRKGRFDCLSSPDRGVAVTDLLQHLGVGDQPVATLDGVSQLRLGAPLVDVRPTDQDTWARSSRRARSRQVAPADLPLHRGDVAGREGVLDCGADGLELPGCVAAWLAIAGGAQGLADPDGERVPLPLCHAGEALPLVLGQHHTTWSLSTHGRCIGSERDLSALVMTCPRTGPVRGSSTGTAAA